MSKIKTALKILEKHNQIEYYAPEEQSKLYWELRGLGEVVDYITEDNGRWTNYDGVVVKFEEDGEALHFRLVKEVGKTECQSDGDYYFSIVNPREKVVIEYI